MERVKSDSDYYNDARKKLPPEDIGRSPDSGAKVQSLLLKD